LETTVKVVLVGDSGVGKTSLVLRYVKGSFHPFQEPTIGAAFLTRTQELPEEGEDENDQNDGAEAERNDVDGLGSSNSRRKKRTARKGRHLVHLKIWDTAGQERYQSLTPLYFRGAGAAVLVFDICRLHSFQALRRWITEIRKHTLADGESMLLMVVGNKSDLAEGRSIPYEDARNFAESRGAFYVETSAKDDRNVQRLFAELSRRAAERLPPDPPARSDVDPNRIDLSSSAGGGTYASSSSGGCCSSSSPSPPSNQPEIETIME